MNWVVYLVTRFGLPTAAGAVLLYVLLRGELTFKYPRK
jgi:hypothetical protein